MNSEVKNILKKIKNINSNMDLNILKTAVINQEYIQQCLCVDPSNKYLELRDKDNLKLETIQKRKVIWEIGNGMFLVVKCKKDKIKISLNMRVWRSYPSSKENTLELNELFDMFISLSQTENWSDNEIIGFLRFLNKNIDVENLDLMYKILEEVRRPLN
jgi:hypothetical protein